MKALYTEMQEELSPATQRACQAIDFGIRIVQELQEELRASSAQFYDPMKFDDMVHLTRAADQIRSRMPDGQGEQCPCCGDFLEQNHVCS